MIIDLRSDTVTRPSEAMRRAMAEAPVGDDVFGDDPTVNRFQDTVAAHFGKEAGLFFPSGTMANQVAIKVHTQPGEEVICDSTAHVYKYEGGGIASNSGCSVRLLNGDRGIFTASDVLDNINGDDVHFPKTSLLVVENTVNKGGGKCWNSEQLEAVTTVAHGHGLSTHLDGARLWNALVVTGQSPLQFGQWFDTISVCFSKGLGCPVGSMLLGSRKQMTMARRIRKRMGGGMRQAGILAAAGIYAFENNISRLATDHEHAKAIEAALHPLDWAEQIMPVETNIVLFKTHNPQLADKVIAKLAENGIRAVATGGGWIRFVTHLDISGEMTDKLTTVLTTIRL